MLQETLSVTVAQSCEARYRARNPRAAVLPIHPETCKMALAENASLDSLRSS